MLVPIATLLTLLCTGRTRIFWGILGTIATVMFALILLHQFKPLHVAPHPKPALDFASRAQIMDAPIPDIAKEAIIGPQMDPADLKPVPPDVANVPADDERLRVFDEL